jgi:hypothetical protein
MFRYFIYTKNKVYYKFTFLALMDILIKIIMFSLKSISNF